MQSTELTLLPICNTDTLRSTTAAGCSPGAAPMKHAKRVPVLKYVKKQHWEERMLVHTIVNKLGTPADYLLPVSGRSGIYRRYRRMMLFMAFRWCKDKAVQAAPKMFHAVILQPGQVEKLRFWCARHGDNGDL